jgi:hypothetical protein
VISLTINCGKGNNHIENIVQENLDVIASGIVASDLDELATDPSCGSTTIREAG